MTQLILGCFYFRPTGNMASPLRDEYELPISDELFSSRSSFSSRYEILVPYSTIELEPSETDSVRDGTRDKDTLTDDRERYASIDVKGQAKTAAPSTIDQPIRQPSRYQAIKAKKLLPTHSTHTRQKSFAIGEEWEQFQHRKFQSRSCPTTPISGRKQNQHIYAINNPGYATGKETQRADGDQMVTSRKDADVLPFHYFFSMPSKTSRDYQICPNPFNKRNHQFHSTLHCPCFFFFFFICCLPGVQFMQMSDKKFKKGQLLKAKKYGRASTILFVCGSIAGVVFLGVAIFFAASYVRQFVS